MTNGLLSGTQVQVIDGTFVGMSGKVISFVDAKKMLEHSPSGPVAGHWPGIVYVDLIIFGRHVPVSLEIGQLKVVTGES